MLDHIKLKLRFQIKIIRILHGIGVRMGRAS